MALKLSTRWFTGNMELDSRVMPLLRAVERTGSLNQAVASLRFSYRHAWGLLGKTERSLGQQLVVLQRGRGAHLSPLGEKLLAADDAATAVLGHGMEAALRSLNDEAASKPSRKAEKPVVIHASHDLALAGLRDLLVASGNVAVDLHFRGSIECLASLSRGDCDIAGFHVPDSEADDSAYAPYRPWLKARTLRLVRFVRRRQGLMVAQGNPKRLLSLADLATLGVRFVNRQPDSGTRLCFDRLLASARVQPERINGYQNEEFTHAAVAATIASGMADAGFGIEAAARQHALDFIPLAMERYFLAARVATLARADVGTLLEEMKQPTFLKRVTALPGYEEQGMGEIVSVREALRTG